MKPSSIKSPAVTMARSDTIWTPSLSTKPSVNEVKRLASIHSNSAGAVCGNKEGANKYPRTTLTVQKRRT